MSGSLKLQKDAIFQIPFNIYENDFTFIVNNKEYSTTKIVADLLSPKIAKLHQTDPTANEFIIKTKHQGNFDYILNLAKFEETEINTDEIQFISEVIEKLGIDQIEFNINEEEIRIDNVVSLIQRHEQFQNFQSPIFKKEINFLSSHFTDILSKQKDEIKKLSYETLDEIINNKSLELDTEDELLSFINELYNEGEKYSPLYEYVYFKNVSVENISDFLRIFDIEYMTMGTWKSISTRLVEEIVTNKKSNTGCQKINGRHKYKNIKNRAKEIPYVNGNLDGVFSYFEKNSNIHDEVDVTFSSKDYGNVDDLLKIQCPGTDFHTADQPDSWICFEFKKNQIKPTNYSIRSYNGDKTRQHPKSWIVEGSQDKNEWTTIDVQKNNSSLRGANIVQTFSIKENEKSFKYLRFKLTGPNWFGSNDCNHRIRICSIEFYGQLIKSDN